ncbi:MAG: hypothetical protein AAGK78_05835, partial [Planctomycetota bacterium]
MSAKPTTSHDEAEHASLPLVVHRGRRGWDDRWGERIGPPLAMLGLGAVVWTTTRNTDWLESSLTTRLTVGGLIAVFSVVLLVLLWRYVKREPDRRLHISAEGWRKSKREPSEDTHRRFKRWPGRVRFVHHRGDNTWRLDLVHHPTPATHQQEWWDTLTAVPPRTLASLPGRPTRRMMREVRAVHEMFAREGLLSGELALQQPRVCPGC